MELSQQEKTLLLFVETCAVDHGGLMNPIHLNDDDHGILKRWNAGGVVLSGRVCSRDISSRGLPSMWCSLSPAAMSAAHAERRSRSTRLWARRDWQTTAEHRCEPTNDAKRL